VLYHDPAYQFALVGHPNREYLWVLSRASEINDVNREQLVKIAQQQGYDTSKLIWRSADPTKL
jgi:apolipoprotein D and lipocalin family protein